MRHPKAFRDKLIDHFERTRKTNWTKQEIVITVMELWWNRDIEKKLTAKTRKRVRKPKPEKPQKESQSPFLPKSD